jgi:hypothetical protein
MGLCELALDSAPVLLMVGVHVVEKCAVVAVASYVGVGSFYACPST